MRFKTISMVLTNAVPTKGNTASNAEFKVLAVIVICFTSDRASSLGTYTKSLLVSDKGSENLNHSGYICFYYIYIYIKSKPGPCLT